jgi:hypothetical protein
LAASLAAIVAELHPRGEDLRQPLGGGMTLLRRPCRHDGGEQRDHAGIEPIVLGQNAGCLGELPQLERVDLALPPLAFSAAAAAAASTCFSVRMVISLN